LARTKSSDLIKENDLERMSETLKAVAHPVRLQIVNILMKGERSVGELVRTLGTKQSLTSQQLSILKSRGVLKSRRNGNVVFYSLDNSGVKNIMATILTEIG
jgi:ArsR family transcriptional regulator